MTSKGSGRGRTFEVSRPEEDIVIPELEKHIGTAKNLPWSTREEKICEKYYKLGVPPKEIARFLGRTPGAINSKATMEGWEFGCNLNREEEILQE